MDFSSQEITLSLFLGKIPQTLTLKTDQVLLAKVIRSTSDGILLAIGGQKIPAQSRIPLEPGSLLKLKVEKLGENNILSLKLIDLTTPKEPKFSAIFPKTYPFTLPDAKLIEHLAQELELKGEDQAAQKLLNSYLKTTIPFFGKSGSAENLKDLTLPAKAVLGFFASAEIDDKTAAMKTNSLFSASQNEAPQRKQIFEDLVEKIFQQKENLGLRFEAALSQNKEIPSFGLKQHLLSISQNFPQAELGNLAKSLSEGLSRFELLDQGRNSLSLIFFPPPDSTDAKPLYLRLEELKEENGSKDKSRTKSTPSARALFHLETPFLGAIWGQIDLKENNIDCVLHLEKEEIKELLASHQEELKEALRREDFNLQQLEFKLEDKKKMEKHQREAFGAAEVKKIDQWI